MKNLLKIASVISMLPASVFSMQNPGSQKLFTHSNIKHQTITFPSEFEIAPDSSEVRILGRIPGVMSSIQCTFHPGSISKAVFHKTITEIWYVLEGDGIFWRKDLDSGAESCVQITKGTTITIPKETIFQFKTIGDQPLKFFIATTPLWPGDEEAVFSKGLWEN